ncbi:MAG: YetF domain-containing protein [Ornithinimicrobium sp.]
MLHDSTKDLLTVAATASLAYVWLVVLLRVSGKRTLAQLNAFDFIVTVALGSIVATVALSESVAWSEGAMALGVLTLLQFVSAAASSRFAWARETLTSKPTVLLRDGQMVGAALLRERIHPDSVCAAVRSSGVGGLESVAFVVLETDGTLSVVPHSSLGSGTALSDLT